MRAKATVGTAPGARAAMPQLSERGLGPGAHTNQPMKRSGRRGSTFSPCHASGCMGALGRHARGHWKELRPAADVGSAVGASQVSRSGAEGAAGPQGAARRLQAAPRAPALLSHGPPRHRAAVGGRFMSARALPDCPLAFLRRRHRHRRRRRHARSKHTGHHPRPPCVEVGTRT